MQAEIKSLRAELARHRQCSHTTNKHKCQQLYRGCSVLLSCCWQRESTQILKLQRLVLPRTLTLQGERAPQKHHCQKGSKQILLAQRLFPPTILALQREQSLQQRHYHSTSIQPLCTAETGPQCRVNYTKLTAKGVITSQTIPTESAADPGEVSSTMTPALPRGEIKTGMSPTLLRTKCRLVPYLSIPPIRKATASLCWKSWKTTNSYCRVCSPSSTEF